MKIFSFKNIWRFNAIVIALTGLLIALAIFYNLWSFLSYSSPKDDFETEATEEVVVGEEKLRLAFDDWIELPGTQYLALKYGITEKEVTYSSSSAFGPSSKYKSDEVEARNVILINKKDGMTRYIAPDNERALYNFYVLKSDEDNAIGFVAQFASKKGNDGTDILVGNLSTGQQSWVLSNVDALDYPKLISPTVSSMIVWTAEKPRFVTIDMNNIEVQVNRPISMTPGVE